MSKVIKIFATDSDDTSQYEVSEIHVSKGDVVDKNDILLVIEGDKTSIEIIAEDAGILHLVHSQNWKYC